MDTLILVTSVRVHGLTRRHVKMSSHDVTKSKLMWSLVLSVTCSECISMHNVRQLDKETKTRCGLRGGHTGRHGGREIGRNRGEDWRFFFCHSGDDLEMPMDVWLMGSAFKTRRQDYVYANCLLD